MSQNPTPGNPSPLKELTGSIGKYNIVKPLGKGAMGIVYLAHDTILERDVALKVMVAQIADDPELLERFKREAKAVAKMTHPNVVNVFDLGSHNDGSPFIAMELLKGQDLQKAMRGAPISLDRKLAIIVQVLAGLAHAHEAGIVHRDIKPANIFINQDGTVKIMDFGVARLTTASMTGTGNIVGTADYMSPEQVKGARVDGRSDLFSVGCMLYELLAGQRPFHSDNLMAIFYKITHEEANFELLPTDQGYQELLPILKRALAKNLDERYQTAYDFATDLRDYLKVHASSRSGQHALEDLARIEPPRAGTPEAFTDAPGATVVQAGTNEVGATISTGATTPKFSGTGTVKGSAPTAVGGRTLGQAPTVVGPGPTPQRSTTGPQSRVARRAPEPEPKSKTGLILGVAAVVVMATGAGLYFAFGPKGDTQITDATPTPAATAATAAPTVVTATAAPTAVVTEPPPLPTVDPGAKAASTLKAAQAALAKGDYGRALEQANAALREDPGSAQAKELANRALAGQKAEGHFRAAESALRGGQFADAQREAESGRALAPGDSRGSDLLLRIGEEQRRAEGRAADAREREAREKEARERAAREAQGKARVNALITRAAGEFASGQYEATVATCKEAMALDPGNETAQKLMIEASIKMGERTGGGSGTRAAVHKFVVGKTSKQSAETKAGGSVPEGFEETAGVNARRASAVTEMPGEIDFDVSPPSPNAGEKYMVKVVFRNDGNAPISLKGLTVTTTINTKKVGPFPIQLNVKDVAPHQKAVLLETPDFWKEDITVWAMEAKVTTARGETYTNTVVWR